MKNPESSILRNYCNLLLLRLNKYKQDFQQNREKRRKMAIEEEKRRIEEERKKKSMKSLKDPSIQKQRSILILSRQNIYS